MEVEEQCGSGELRAGSPAKTTPKTSAARVNHPLEMSRVLKGAMLDLLHHCYYHSERKDERFWNSELHCALLEMVCSELESMFGGAPSALSAAVGGGGGGDTEPLSSSEEALAHRILSAVNG